MEGNSCSPRPREIWRHEVRVAKSLNNLLDKIEKKIKHIIFTIIDEHDLKINHMKMFILVIKF